MKNLMTRSVLAAVALFALAACDLPGSLTATQSFSLKDKKGRVVPLEAGRSYNAAISKDDGMLKIEIKNVYGNDYKVLVPPPAGQTIPEQEGEIFVSAAQSGQPVDMHGIMNTAFDRGPDQYGSQRCYEYRPVQVCQQVWVQDNHGGHYVYQCHMEQQQVPGDQEVVYHVERETRTGTIHFMQPNKSTTVGQFYGQAVSTNNVVTWQGYCRTYGY